MEAEEQIRRIFKVGGSLVFAVPREYIETHNIKAGDQLRIYYNDLLHAQPIEKGKLSEKLERMKEILETS